MLFIDTITVMSIKYDLILFFFFMSDIFCAIPTEPDIIISD